MEYHSLDWIIVIKSPNNERIDSTCEYWNGLTQTGRCYLHTLALTITERCTFPSQGNPNAKLQWSWLFVTPISVYWISTIVYCQRRKTTTFLVETISFIIEKKFPATCKISLIVPTSFISKRNWSSYLWSELLHFFTLIKKIPSLSICLSVVISFLFLVLSILLSLHHSYEYSSFVPVANSWDLISKCCGLTDRDRRFRRLSYEVAACLSIASGKWAAFVREINCHESF